MPLVSHQATIRAIGLDPVEAQPRQAFFFDTPDLCLEPRRPGRPGPANPGRNCRHGHQAPSGRPSHDRRRASSLGELQGRGGCDARRIRVFGVVQGRVPDQSGARRDRRRGSLSSLFSKEQRAFYKAHAPAGLSLDSLTVLGPTFVLKAKHQPKDFDRRIVVEMWLYPDGSRILERLHQGPAGRSLPGRRHVQGLPGEAEASRSPHRRRRKPRPRWISTRPKSSRIWVALYRRRCDEIWMGDRLSLTLVAESLLPSETSCM